MLESQWFTDKSTQLSSLSKIHVNSANFLKGEVCVGITSARQHAFFLSCWSHGLTAKSAQFTHKELVNSMPPESTSPLSHSSMGLQYSMHCTSSIGVRNRPHWLIRPTQCMQLAQESNHLTIWSAWLNACNLHRSQITSQIGQPDSMHATCTGVRNRPRWSISLTQRMRLADGWAPGRECSTEDHPVHFGAWLSGGQRYASQRLNHYPSTFTVLRHFWV